MRSALYVPCDHARALQKTHQLKADAFIFDLEDGVAPEAKATGREQIAALTLPASAYTMLRINHRSTTDYAADLTLLATLPVQAVMLSKTHDLSDVEDCCARLAASGRGDLAVWCNIETPHGVTQAEALCAHARVGGVVAGTNDLANDLRIRPGAGREGLLHSLQRIQLAARAHGKTVLDGTFVQTDDDAGFEAECAQGRMLGFDGKTLIHPKQIEGANRHFGPTPEDMAWAQAVIAAYEPAMRDGKAVTLLDGRMIEALHYRRAQEILAQAG
jgi:citrate lyase beta subunit